MREDNGKLKQGTCGVITEHSQVFRAEEGLDPNYHSTLSFIWTIHRPAPRDDANHANASHYNISTLRVILNEVQRVVGLRGAERS